MCLLSKYLSITTVGIGPLTVSRSDHDTARGDQKAYDFRSGPVKLWECDAVGFGTAAQYCCESAAESTRCCSTSSVLTRLAAATVGAFTGASVSATTTAESSDATHRTVVSLTTATMSTATATTTSTSDASGSRSHSNGATIGGAVGGVLGGLALLGVAGFFFWRWRKQKQSPRHEYTAQKDGVGQEVYDGKGSYVYAQAHPLDSPYTHLQAHDHPPVELPSRNESQELSAVSR